MFCEDINEPVYKIDRMFTQLGNIKKFRDNIAALVIGDFSGLDDRDMFIEYIKQKEILFIKNDIKDIKNSKIDYSKLIKYYKRKLVDYGVMKEIRNSYKSEGKFLKVRSKEVA